MHNQAEHCSSVSQQTTGIHGTWSRPRMEGYVVLEDARSLPAVLPSCSVVCVMSRMSSTTCAGRPAAGQPLPFLSGTTGINGAAAQWLESPKHVKHILQAYWQVMRHKHLEGEADVAGVGAQAGDVLLGGAAHDGAAHHRRLQQRCRLVLVDVLQRGQPHLQGPCTPTVAFRAWQPLGGTQPAPVSPGCLGCTRSCRQL
jgi:hypothetical protein